jgi:hypothetical protein
VCGSPSALSYPPATARLNLPGGRQVSVPTFARASMDAVALSIRMSASAACRAMQKPLGGQETLPPVIARRERRLASAA